MIETNKIYNTDALTLLQQLDNESVDLIIIDPPYGIDYKSNRGSDEYRKQHHSHMWDKEFHFGNYIDELLPEYVKIAEERLGQETLRKYATLETYDT